MPGNRTNLPDHTITDSKLTLTPLGRYQVSIRRHENSKN